MSSEADSSPIIPYYYSWFPGEDFLSVELPDYEKERRQIVQSIIVVVVLFIFILPYLFATKKVTTSSNENNEDSGLSSKENAVAAEHPSTDSYQSTKKRNKRRNGKKDKQPQEIKQPQTKTAEKIEAIINPAKEEIIVEFSSTASNILTILCVLVIFAILFFSDSNLFPARTVLLAPVLTKEECKHVIDMANAAAGRNAEISQKEKDELLLEHPGFLELETVEKDENSTGKVDPYELELDRLDSMLKEPSGWKKDRHNHYPTTDLNFVTDPFTPEDRAWLADKLNGRLAPIVERSFGIFRGAIRANDIFVVRYDATKGQPNLRKHTDSSHLSFNILLNNEFEGGGTRFHSQQKDNATIEAHPEVGEALISHAQIQHEGLATTKGTRYILVGFDSIDEKDPLTGESTNLSIFSSWLNLPWMQVRFKDGVQDGTKSRRRILNNVGGDLAEHWKYSRYAVGLFSDLYVAMSMWINIFAKFHSIKTVNTKDFDNYFKVMDNAMQRQKELEAKLGVTTRSRGAGYASWFQGQNLDLDVFGNLKSVWKSRSAQEDKFRSENL